MVSCSEKQIYESSATQAASIENTVTQDTVAQHMAGKAAVINFTRYEGVYKMESASFDAVAVTHEDGKLFAQATGEQKVQIYPEKDHIFSVPAFNASITFTRQADSTFSGIIVLLDGKQLKGNRK